MINIYIGNLPYGVRDTDLIDLFSPYGSITKATVVIDRETGRSKGFGFVEMADRASGQDAINALGGKPYRGRPLTPHDPHSTALPHAHRGAQGGRQPLQPHRQGASRLRLDAGGERRRSNGAMHRVLPRVASAAAPPGS